MKANSSRNLPNFNDLFLNYGNTNSGKSQNNSGCSRDAKDNDLSIGTQKYNQSPANDEPLRMDSENGPMFDWPFIRAVEYRE